MEIYSRYLIYRAEREAEVVRSRQRPAPPATTFAREFPHLAATLLSSPPPTVMLGTRQTLGRLFRTLGRLFRHAVRRFRRHARVPRTVDQH